jgi:hypothetical protein
MRESLAELRAAWSELIDNSLGCPDCSSDFDEPHHPTCAVIRLELALQAAEREVANV